ncbi:hypothetical protein FRC08_008032, partial [Ceratobasidium sp. 394]
CLDCCLGWSRLTDVFPARPVFLADSPTQPQLLARASVRIYQHGMETRTQKPTDRDVDNQATGLVDSHS